MTDFVVFAGRLHPTLVHLPIGFLILAGALDLLARRPSFANARAAVAPALALGAVAACCAAAAGLLLGGTGGYSGATFLWHQRLGVTLGLTAVLAALTRWRAEAVRDARLLRASRGLVAAAVVLLIVTGHLGGTLTHGEGYLTEYLPFLGGGRAAAKEEREPGDVRVFEELVQPVLQAKCAGCHGGEDARAKLRLDSAEGIKQGGESGAVVAAGDPESSELMRRVRLPASHADAMPPRGHAGLTVAEAELLRWWIAEGASFESTLADVELPDHVEPIVESIAGPVAPRRPAVLSLDVPPAGDEAIRGVEALGVSVSAIAADTALLSVQCATLGRAFGDAQLETVAEGLGPQVTWLDLSGTAVTDAGLAALKRFPNLTRLDLDRTAVTDAALAHVASLKALESLNLYGTRITDAGLQRLETLENLRSLYLWQTEISEAGAERLRTANPRLRVERGLALTEAASADAEPTEKP